MALTGINQTARPVVRKKGRAGGSEIGGLLGALAGGALGSLAVPGVGTAAGAKLGGLTGGAAMAAGGLGGAAGGQGIGSLIGGGIDPGKQESVQQAAPPAPVQLTASDEAIRGQQLLTGLQASQNNSLLSEYSIPLTQGYIKSMINLKNMG